MGVPLWLLGRVKPVWCGEKPPLSACVCVCVCWVYHYGCKVGWNPHGPDKKPPLRVGGGLAFMAAR